jgi:hypothetical protein
MTTSIMTTESLAVLDGQLQELQEADGKRHWRTPDDDVVSLSIKDAWPVDADTRSLAGLRRIVDAGSASGTAVVTVRVIATDWIRGVEVTREMRRDGDTDVCTGELHVPFDAVTFQFDVTCRGEHTSWGGPLPMPAQRLGVLLRVVAAAVRPEPALIRTAQRSFAEPDQYVPPPCEIVRALNSETEFNLLRRLVGAEVNTILTPSMHVFAETGAMDVAVAAIVAADRPLLLHAGSVTGGLRSTSVDYVTVVDTDSTLESYVSSIRIALHTAPVERVQVYQRHFLSWAHDEEFRFDAVLVLWRTDGVAVRLRAMDSGVLAVSVSSPGIPPERPRYSLRWDSRWPTVTP